MESSLAEILNQFGYIQPNVNLNLISDEELDKTEEKEESEIKTEETKKLEPNTKESI